MSETITPYEKLITSKMITCVLVFFFINATTGMMYLYPTLKYMFGGILAVVYLGYLFRLTASGLVLKISKEYGMIFCIFIFSIVLSSITGYLLGFSPPEGEGWYMLVLQLIKVLLFFVFVDLYKRNREVLIEAFIIVGTLFAIHGILQFLLVGFGFVTGTDFSTSSITSYNYSYRDFGILGWARVPFPLPFGIFYRAHSFFFEPIYFASFLGINIAVILMFYKKGYKRKLLLLINALCLLFTVSIAVIIAVFIGWFIYSIKTMNIKYLSLLIILFTALTIAFFTYIGLEFKSGSSENRFHRFVSTIDVIFDGYGVLGTGRNNEESITEHGIPSDQWLRLWLNHGLLGLISFLLINIYIFIRLRTKMKYFYFPFIFVVMSADMLDNLYYFWIVMAILYLSTQGTVLYKRNSVGIKRGLHVPA